MFILTLAQKLMPAIAIALLLVPARPLSACLGNSETRESVREDSRTNQRCGKMLSSLVPRFSLKTILAVQVGVAGLTYLGANWYNFQRNVYEERQMTSSYNGANYEYMPLQVSIKQLGKDNVFKYMANDYISQTHQAKGDRYLMPGPVILSRYLSDEKNQSLIRKAQDLGVPFNRAELLKYVGDGKYPPNDDLGPENFVRSFQHEVFENRRKVRALLVSIIEKKWNDYLLENPNTPIQYGEFRQQMFEESLAH